MISNLDTYHARPQYCCISISHTCNLIIYFLTVSVIADLLKRVSSCGLCEGNCDDRFLKLPNVHKGVMLDTHRMFTFMSLN